MLATVPGISQISRYDMDRWGDFWRFTTLSMRRLFEQSFAPADVAVTSRGKTTQGPQIVKAPFKPNPGRAVAWLFMGGFVGGAIFAGGNALGASSANSAYTHAFEYEGRCYPSLTAVAKAVTGSHWNGMLFFGLTGSEKTA